MALVLVIGLLPGTALAAGKSITDYFSGMPITADGGSGTTAWKVSGNMLMSGNKGKSYSTSTLTLTFTADTAISFEYRVSSEKNYDKCTITLGNTTIADAISGDGDWIGYTGTANANDKLVIIYKKDSSGDDKDDCVYLRNFSCGTPTVVTFHANGGTGDDYTQNIYGGKGTLTANTFTNTGKVFAGWATSVDGTVVYTDGAEITVDSNTDLYAIWGDAYTVIFDNDGEKSTVDVAQNTAIGATKMLTDPTKRGYTFEGWFNGETKLTAETKITADVTYTAKWTPIQYTIVLNPGDGAGEPVTLNATYDQDVTLPKNTFTYDGYDFVGWSTSRSSSYGSTADEATVKNLTDKAGATYNLYAAWKGKPVNVTLDFNYDGKEKETRTGTIGSNKYYANIEDPVRTGYIFDGWFDASEGGNEIDYSYKFTAEDAKNGKTLYAHWTKGITVHFDGNGYNSTIADKTVKPDEVFSKLPYLSSYSYPSNKTLDGWYIKTDDGSFGDAVTEDTDFSSLDEVTLIAKWRSYQVTVSFNANKGTGEMDKLVCESGVETKLPKCTFTRDGYDFIGWATYSYSSTVTYADEAEYTGTARNGDTSATLYALWKENVSKAAIDAVNKEISSDNIVRAETSLPTSGTGYTIAYASESALVNSDGKITLPETGTATVTVTATITDTNTKKTYTKEYTLTLYSAAVAATEAELNAAVDKLTGNFVPVYGTDTNAITAVEKKLLDAGCEGIAVSVKEAVADNNNYASIDKDGTIHYYFNPNMTKYGGYFYTLFVLSKNGASVEKKWYTSIDWDKAKVREALEAVADTLTVPETATADMTLPLNANDKGWSKVTWVSSDAALKIGSASYYTSTYPVTLNATENTTVVLTATVTCNNVDGVSLTRTFDCTVPAGSGAPAVNYQQKLDNALTETGLKDFVTGEKMTMDENGVYTTVNDIQFPTTRNLKIDGKYTPIVITSSDTDVIENPDVANAARVNIYRPLPGQAAKDVTVTIKILDRSSGTGKDYTTMPVLATKDIKISVQPLTQDEINAEVALMAKVKENYWNGIRNANTDQKNVTTDMHAFQECYLNNNNDLTWVYDYRDLKNHGIVPVDMDGWYDTQLWRLFKSSNAAVVAHENLLVTRSEDSKAVTITSWLSSETLGKYAEKYPENAAFQKLYKQPVSIDLVVTGTKYAQGSNNRERENAAENALSNRSKVTVNSFTLTGSGMGFTEGSQTYSEGSTVYDVFCEMLDKHQYTCNRKGSYIASITSNTGVTLAEFDEGKNSGWMYKVNGEIPGKYMSQYVLTGGETIEVFFTKDYTHESGTGGWSKPSTPAEPTTPTCPFTDITTHWAKDAVTAAWSKGWIKGVSETAFAPENQMTRGMLVTVLHRLDGEPTAGSVERAAFHDVASDAYYAKAVAWAAENGIVKGVREDLFAPDASITREQLAAILYRYANDKKMDTTQGGMALHEFTDESSISDYARDAMEWAVNVGLLQGVGEGKLAPQGTATRAQVATMLVRFDGLNTTK